MPSWAPASLSDFSRWHECTQCRLTGFKNEIKNLWCIVHSAWIKQNCSVALEKLRVPSLQGQRLLSGGGGHLLVWWRWHMTRAQLCKDDIFIFVFCQVEKAVVHTLGRHLVHMLAWWRWHVTCAQLFKYDICFCLLTGGGGGCSHLWPSFGPPAGNPLRLGRPRCTSPILRRVCQPGLHGGPA